MTPEKVSRETLLQRWTSALQALCETHPTPTQLQAAQRLLESVIANRLCGTLFTFINPDDRALRFTISSLPTDKLDLSRSWPTYSSPLTPQDLQTAATSHLKTLATYQRRGELTDLIPQVAAVKSARGFGGHTVEIISFSSRPPNHSFYPSLLTRGFIFTPNQPILID